MSKALYYILTMLPAELNFSSFPIHKFSFFSQVEQKTAARPYHPFLEAIQAIFDPL